MWADSRSLTTVVWLGIIFWSGNPSFKSWFSIFNNLLPVTCLIYFRVVLVRAVVWVKMKHFFRTSLLSVQQSTGTSCSERLWSLLLWRYSRLVWTPTSLYWCVWLLFPRCKTVRLPLLNLPRLFIDNWKKTTGKWEQKNNNKRKKHFCHLPQRSWVHPMGDHGFMCTKFA